MVRRSWLVWIAAAVAGGCVAERPLATEAMMDPAACEPCHPDHYREWAGSMHAYASDDPMFRVLNDRLQRDTDGAAGSFCIGCHAPMAVRTGATVDGTDLDDVPRRLQGVTCYFCHVIDAVEAPHNGSLRLATDDVMRGRYADSLRTPAHESAHSPFLDGRTRSASDACGSCHDVVTPAGVHLERTYAEWQESIFGQDGPAHLSCGACHMPGRDAPIAAVEGAAVRRFHGHAMPGVDVALSRWPETDGQHAAIRAELAPTLKPRLCVMPGPGGLQMEVQLDNIGAGHKWPSGVTHARRAWVEVRAFAGDDVVYETGVVAPDEPVLGRDDPDLWAMRSVLYDGDGNEVALPWLATSSESELLGAAVTLDPTDPGFFHSSSRTYAVISAVPVTRVTMAVHLRPVGLDLVDALVATEGLDPSVRDAVPTFTATPTQLEWTDERGFGCVP